MNERTEVVLSKVQGENSGSDVKGYIFTPLFGYLYVQLGHNVILSEVRETNEGIATEPIGVYEPPKQISENTIKISLKPVPDGYQDQFLAHVRYCRLHEDIVNLRRFT